MKKTHVDPDPDRRGGFESIGISLLFKFEEKLFAIATQSLTR